MANNRELSQFGAFVEVNNSTGKIGILTDIGVGTSNPLHKLDVNGEVGISPNTAGKSTHVFTTNATDDGRYLLKSNTTVKVDIQSNGSSYFNGGNVGFGISTPEQKIHVDGTILATQLSTGASGTGINVTTNSITGPATLIIDPAADVDDTGTVQIKGNLTVLGTTTTINSSTVNFNQISLGDNEKIQIGDSNDLELYHDGSNSYIADTGTGELRILASQFVVKDAANTKNVLIASPNGSVSLSHDGATKIATSSTGVTVTGTVVADGLTLGDNDNLYIGDSNDLRIVHDGSNSYIKDDGTGSLFIQTNGSSVTIQNTSAVNIAEFVNGSSVNLYHNGSKKFETTSTGATVTGTLVADGISLGDSEVIKLGTGEDLQLYHNGTDSYISDSGDGNLHLNTNGASIRLISDASTIDGKMADFTKDGAVTLYFDNNIKFATTTGGISVTGQVDLNSVGIIKTATKTVTTTSPDTIDSFSTTAYRSARFHIQITQGTNYQSAEVMVIHDGTTADIIEYGSIATGDYLGTFSASISAGSVLLRVTMTSATSAAVKVISQLVAI